MGVQFAYFAETEVYAKKDTLWGNSQTIGIKVYPKRHLPGEL